VRSRNLGRRQAEEEKIKKFLANTSQQQQTQTLACCLLVTGWWWLVLLVHIATNTNTCLSLACYWLVVAGAAGSYSCFFFLWQRASIPSISTKTSN
jgi:hypothetical protein